MEQDDYFEQINHINQPIRAKFTPRFAQLAIATKESEARACWTARLARASIPLRHGRASWRGAPVPKLCPCYRAKSRTKQEAARS